MVPLEGVAAELLLVTSNAATISATRQDMAIRTPSERADGVWNVAFCLPLRDRVALCQERTSVLSTDLRALIFMIDSQAATTEVRRTVPNQPCQTNKLECGSLKLCCHSICTTLRDS